MSEVLGDIQAGDICLDSPMEVISIWMDLKPQVWVSWPGE